MQGAAPIDATSNRSVPWLARNLDIVAVLLWLVMSALLGFSRKDFTGDGVRHLQPILDFVRPSLGEPRWLLFPAFLFALLRPFVALGILTTAEGLTTPMMAATVMAAALYLFSIRICLIALGVNPRKRALSLLVAGFTGGLFFAASDLMEPIFAAAIAMAGLAFAAARQARPSGSDRDRQIGVLVAVVAIAVASFLYQGVILAVGLIPLFVPWATLRNRRTAVISMLVLAAVPLLTAGMLVSAGNTAGHAIARFLEGEENPLYRSYLKRPGLSPYLVALIGGPPQGVLAIPEFHGFNGLLSGLRAPGARLEVLTVVARLAIGLVVVWGVVLAAIRRRDLATLFALGVVFLLPLVRHQQYSYLKYYILLPAILAVAACRAPSRLVVPVVVGLAVINGAVLVGRIRDGRALYEARSRVYSKAAPADCWVATGWGPPLNFKWGGSVCGVLGALAGGSGNNVKEVIAQSHADLTRCLQRCFCQASAVYTDDMTDQAGSVLTETAAHFEYRDVDLTAFTIPVTAAKLISSPGAAGGPVYEYPRNVQEKYCLALSVAP